MLGKWTIVVLALALSACGGRRDAVHAARFGFSERSGPEVIACFGDSLTAGYGVARGASYPDNLQRMLDAGGTRYRVLNLGVSGETTADGVARLPLVLAEKPDLVVLEFGANDGLRGISVDVATRNLEHMIDTLQKGGTRVVLAGMILPPSFATAYTRRFGAMFSDLADRYHLTLIPFILEGVAGYPRFMQPDGLHPNAEGAQRLADTVFRAIQGDLRNAP
jgi:acyl-CoA thioesterase-1